MRYETPEPSLTPEESKVVHYCTCCGCEIYEGEEYYHLRTFNPSLRVLNVCETCMQAACRVAGEDD